MSELYREFEAGIDEELRKLDVAGIVVAIVSEGDSPWYYGAGRANGARNSPPTENTLFRVASVTKTFTATAILQLRDKGLLELDAPLARYIPEFAGAKAVQGTLEGVTIRRLLAHHSGLCTEAPLRCWDASEFPDRQQLLDAIPQTEVVIPQDSAFKYSNLAYGLLGEVVSRLAGRPYIDCVRAEILEPLELESTVFSLPEAWANRLATGYYPRLGKQAWEPAAPIPLNGLAACGGLYSSAKDLARWVSSQWNELGLEGTQRQPILRASSLQEMHRPQYLEPDWSIGYCLSWRANRFGDRIYHGHGGGIFGYTSQILFSKVSRVGAVCLANTWPSQGLLELAGWLLDKVIASRVNEPSGQAEAAMPPTLARFLGTYAAVAGIRLAIEYRQGQLQFAPVCEQAYRLHAPAILEPSGSDTFRIRGGRGAGETIRFTPTSQNGKLQFEVGGFVYRQES